MHLYLSILFFQKIKKSYLKSNFFNLSYNFYFVIIINYDNNLYSILKSISVAS